MTRTGHAGGPGRLGARARGPKARRARPPRPAAAPPRRLPSSPEASPGSARRPPRPSLGRPSPPRPVSPRPGARAPRPTTRPEAEGVRANAPAGPGAVAGGRAELHPRTPGRVPSALDLELQAPRRANTCGPARRCLGSTPSLGTLARPGADLGWRGCRRRRGRWRAEGGPPRVLRRRHAGGQAPARSGASRPPHRSTSWVGWGTGGVAGGGSGPRARRAGRPTGPLEADRATEAPSGPHPRPPALGPRRLPPRSRADGGETGVEGGAVRRPKESLAGGGGFASTLPWLRPKVPPGPRLACSDSYHQGKRLATPDVLSGSESCRSRPGAR